MNKVLFNNIQQGISQLSFLKAAYLVLVMSVFLSDMKVGQGFQVGF